MADENSLIRVGKVSAINASQKKARVFYPSMSNMVSDWLPVLQFPALKTGSAGGHGHTDSMGGGTSTNGSHSHFSSEWMPKVNDKVLVVMEFGFNSGGYIMGVIP